MTRNTIYTLQSQSAIIFVLDIHYCLCKNVCPKITISNILCIIIIVIMKNYTNPLTKHWKVTVAFTSPLSTVSTAVS